MAQQYTGKYRVEVIFRFNQEPALPDSIKDVHRVANTEYFEIVVGTIHYQDFGRAYGNLMSMHGHGHIVAFYYVKEGE